MTKSKLVRVDANFKKMLDDIKDKNGCSSYPEASRLLKKDIEVLKKNKKKKRKKDRDAGFGLFFDL